MSDAGKHFISWSYCIWWRVVFLFPDLPFLMQGSIAFSSLDISDAGKYILFWSCYVQCREVFTFPVLLRAMQGSIAFFSCIAMSDAGKYFLFWSSHVQCRAAFPFPVLLCLMQGSISFSRNPQNCSNTDKYWGNSLESAENFVNIVRAARCWKCQYFNTTSKYSALCSGLQVTLSAWKNIISFF